MTAKRSKEKAGFSLIDLAMIIGILAILAVVMLRAFSGRPSRSPRIQCVNNLKQVGLAFRQWGIGSYDSYVMRVPVAGGGAKERAEAGSVYPIFMVMSNELNTPKILVCPADKRRISATTFDSKLPLGRRDIPFTNDAFTSYLVGLDADDTAPQTFLSGDSNWETGGKPIPHGVINLWTNTPVAWSDSWHRGQGNVLLADGSVQGYSTWRLLKALAATGHATNRLVFPPPK